MEQFRSILAVPLAGRRVPVLATILVFGLLCAQLGSLAHATQHALEGEDTSCHLCTLAGLLGKTPVSVPITASTQPASPVVTLGPRLHVTGRRPAAAWAARAPPPSGPLSSG